MHRARVCFGAAKHSNTLMALASYPEDEEDRADVMPPATTRIVLTACRGWFSMKCPMHPFLPLLYTVRSWKRSFALNLAILYKAVSSSSLFEVQLPRQSTALLFWMRMRQLLPSGRWPFLSLLAPPLAVHKSCRTMCDLAALTSSAMQFW